jgi:hypothetical protein
MQADPLSAPISEGAAGRAGGPAAPAVRRRGIDTTRLLSLQIAIAAIVGFATTVIWGMAGGGFYWPAYGAPARRHRRRRARRRRSATGAG